MGDIADWLIDQFGDSPEDFDEDDQWVERKPPRCNRCGSTAVRWRQQTGRWVLFGDKPGVLHNCQQRGPATADEFGEVK
jgi:hypothetical protein